MAGCALDLSSPTCLPTQGQKFCLTNDFNTLLDLASTNNRFRVVPRTRRREKSGGLREHTARQLERLLDVLSEAASPVRLLPLSNPLYDVHCSPCRDTTRTYL